MDLIIYTAATNKQQSAVTSLTDTTPVESLEQLVLGDNAPLSVTFTDGSAAPSWAGAAGYTMAVGLGIPDINGQSDCVFQDDVTAITGGWSCTLDLTTQQIVDALALDTGSAVDWTRYPMQSRLPRPRPQGGYFTLQIVVTDPTGKRVTYASLRVFLLNRVIDTATVAPQPPTEYLTAAESVAMFQPLDSDLTAIAALGTTAFGRAVLALANAAAFATHGALGSADSVTFANITTTAVGGTIKYSPTTSDINQPAIYQETVNGDPALTFYRATGVSTYYAARLICGDLNGTGQSGFKIQIAAPAAIGAHTFTTVLATIGVAPASAGAIGIAGQIEFDANYLYHCIATSTWKRVAISTW